jgi:hypothetical protein
MFPVRFETELDFKVVVKFFHNIKFANQYPNFAPSSNAHCIIPNHHKIEKVIVPNNKFSQKSLLAKFGISFLIFSNYNFSSCSESLSYVWVLSLFHLSGFLCNSIYHLITPFPFASSLVSFPIQKTLSRPGL